MCAANKDIDSVRLAEPIMQHELEISVKVDAGSTLDTRSLALS